MRCSRCGENVDHKTSYMFLVDGRSVLLCDQCREKYLEEQRDIAQAMLKAARLEMWNKRKNK